MSRNALKILRSELPQRNLFAKKAEGVITLDFVPLARLFAPDAENYEIKWNASAIATNGLDRDKLNNVLRDGLRSEVELISWG